MSPLERNGSISPVTERAVNTPSSQEGHRSLNGEGTFAHTVAVFGALKEHQAKMQERQDVADAIAAAKTVKTLADRIAKAYGTRLDPRDDRAIRTEMYRYTQQLHGRPSPEEQKRLEGWHAVLDQYLKTRERLTELRAKYSEPNSFHDPEAREVFGIIGMNEAKNERGAALESLQRNFAQEDTVAFTRLRDELSVALNKGEKKIDVMDPQQVSSVLQGWKRGLDAATTETERASYSKWIAKLEQLNALRPREQKAPEAEAQKSGPATEGDALEAFLANKPRNEREDPLIKTQLEEVNRLHPESIEQFILQEALSKGYLKGTEKTIGEDLLNVLVTQDQLHVAEDRWYTKHFGEAYTERKARETELKKSALALEDWRGNNRNDYTSTAQEVVQIDRQFNSDPAYTEAIQREKEAVQTLDKATVDIARKLEVYLSDKNQTTKDLFIHSGDNGVVDPKFVKDVVRSSGNWSQKTILNDMGIFPQEALLALEKASSELRVARSEFVHARRQEIDAEQRSIHKSLEGMKASKQAEYKAELGTVIQAAEQATARTQTTTHKSYRSTLSGKVTNNFDQSKLDETLSRLGALDRIQSFLFKE